MTQPLAIVLAAGKGTRMKSDLPKVAHTICDKPMIEYVLSAAREAGVGRIVVVVGYQADVVRNTLSGHDDLGFALQEEQLGTGHAVMMCESELAQHDGPVLVLAGDTPLLKASSLRALLEEQQNRKAGCVVGSATTENNHGLGRIVRDDAGQFLKIVEQKDCTPEQQAIQEINTGCYVFDSQSLLAVLKQLRPDNQQSEYYLTDCAEILKQEGKTVAAANVFDIQEAMGVNTTDQLADVERILTGS